jgi:hypothetical protein
MKKIHKRVKKWGKLAVHNYLVHPFLPFIPDYWAKVLHEKNAVWAFGSLEGE